MEDSLIVNIVLSLIIIYLISEILKQRKHIRSIKDIHPKYFIPQVQIEDFDERFKPTRFGPTPEVAVQFLPKCYFRVPGGTSDMEAWILSVFAKNSKNIFEFGTFSGKTTYLLAKNAPDDAKVVTLTLGPDQVDQYNDGSSDSNRAKKHALDEINNEGYIYTGTDVEKKITQLYNDSKVFDESPYLKTMDLIFIDGSHAYSYIKSDTEKALKMLKPGGVICWHDYHKQSPSKKDVYRCVNEFSKDHPIINIDRTTLAVLKT